MKQLDSDHSAQSVQFRRRFFVKDAGSTGWTRLKTGMRTDVQWAMLKSNVLFSVYVAARAGSNHDYGQLNSLNTVKGKFGKK